MFDSASPRNEHVLERTFVCQLDGDRKEATSAEAEMALSRIERCSETSGLQVGKEAAAAFVPAHSTQAAIVRHCQVGALEAGIQVLASGHRPISCAHKLSAVL